jgi:putrescine transport system substrate-binding protein
MNRRLLLCAASFVWLFGSAAGRAEPNPRTEIAVLGPADYFEPSLFADFAQDTGVALTYDSYDSTENFDARLNATGGYDLVVVPAGQLKAQIAAKRLQRLDRGKIAGASGFEPLIADRLAALDPTRSFALPYQWSVFGFAYDAEKAAGKVPESWAALFRPAQIDKLNACGLAATDDADGMFTAALLAQRLSPETTAAGDYVRAAQLLGVLRRKVKISTADVLYGLSNGSVCFALANSGDARLARGRAADAPAGRIAFQLPQEGGILSLDTLAIPAQAPHPAAALQLLDFLLRRDNAARESAFSGLRSAVASANISGTPFPPIDARTRLVFPANPDRTLRNFQQREWGRLKP